MIAPVSDGTGAGPAGAGPIRVSPLRRRDLRAVLRIEQRTSSTPWSLGLFLAEVRREDRLYLAARDGHRLVGYAGMLLIGSDGHVTTISVDPDRQGGAVGTRLLLALVRSAADEGIEAVTLEVRASNEPALALYRRFGFAPAGVRKDYYSDPTEDALVLWAHDIHQVPYADRLAGIESRLPGPLVVEGLDAPYGGADDEGDDDLDEPEEGERP